MKYITEADVENISSILDETEKANDEGNISEVIRLFTKFNTELYNLSKMKILPAMISNLNSYLHKFRTISIEDSERRKKALLEHRHILDAILSKDRNLAEMIIKKHLYDSLDVVLQEISK